MTMTIEAPTATIARRTSVSLTPAQFESIASATVAASKNEVTPVIMGVQVSVTDGTLTALATDRWRVARITFPVSGEGDLEGVNIPRGVLESFVKTVKAAKPPISGEFITLTIGDDRAFTLSDTFSGATVTGQTVYGDFPPVARLFPDENGYGECEAVNLNLAYVADAAKLRHPALGASDYKHGAMRLRFTKTANPSKPGPVIIDRASIPAAEGTLDYMVQPNLLLR